VSGSVYPKMYSYANRNECGVCSYLRGRILSAVYYNTHVVQLMYKEFFRMVVIPLIFFVSQTESLTARIMFTQRLWADSKMLVYFFCAEKLSVVSLPFVSVVQRECVQRHCLLNQVASVCWRSPITSAMKPHKSPE
jgi:hypothetical protein